MGLPLLTTFEPALAADRWPWPDLKVFVLASQRPAHTPDHVVVDSDPVRLLDRLQAANRGGDNKGQRGPASARCAVITAPPGRDRGAGHWGRPAPVQRPVRRPA
jgi:hypothetical protein